MNYLTLHHYIATCPKDHRKWVFDGDNKKVSSIPDWLYELCAKDGSLTELCEYIGSVNIGARSHGQIEGRTQAKNKMRRALGLEETP